MPGRVAFVPLRYGPQIVGGSEALTREIAMGLAGRGWEVDVLTTRVVDHQAMADELPEGVEETDGLRVHRFSTQPHWSKPGLKAQRLIQEDVMPPPDDQWTWVGWRFTMPDLFHHLLRHGQDYDAVVFSPYMFWNTTVGLSAVGANAVVMPCLHDESYARLSVMRPVLSDPASVWFLSEPEHRLAHRLGPVAERHRVTGAGIHVPDGYDPESFRRRHSVTRPFVLYAGRREKDKGWGWLLDTFSAAVAGGLEDVDLLTFGSGTVEVPPSLAGRVIDLGFVSETDRNNAFAAALAYAQPSRMESFSRTVMEAWLAGTPVLAIDRSEVVGWHIERSGGGLIFPDGPTLAGHLRELAADPGRAADLAARGRHYVLREYDWPVVLDRIEADLDHLVGGADPLTGATSDTAGAGAAGTATGTAGTATGTAGTATDTGAAGTATGTAGTATGTGAAGTATGTGAVGPARWDEPGRPGGRMTGPGVASALVRPVLVVGSYPPIPVAGASATLAEVRRAWAGGAEVTVVAPRLSAAHLTVPIHGVLAGRRLANVRRVTGADHVVLVLEDGYPFPVGPAPLQMATCMALEHALEGFRHVRVVRAGATSLAPAVWNRLVAAADEVTEVPPGPTAPGVTPLGPPEVTPAERPGQLAEAAARRLLGPRYPVVRARLGSLRRAIHRR
ncbi:MAG: glycosyltransferase [Actinomycetota bacterium]|nr:glycosyltransferase [Actinomycetota bacterium]